jgi:hypothetical protein
LLGRSIGGRKLQGIGSAQWMHPKKANRGLADDITRLDFVPDAAQLPQPFENTSRVARVERTITLYPGQRRGALNLGPTKRAWWNLAWPALAAPGSMFWIPGAGRSPRRPKISSAVPPLFNKDGHRRSAALHARRLFCEERLRHASAGRPQNTFADKPRDPPILFVFAPSDETDH